MADADKNESSSKSLPPTILSVRGNMHTFEIRTTKFTVPTRYMPLKRRPIGSGAYGMVIAARDTVAGEDVAIKKISNVFADLLNAKRTLREIMLLRRFEHESILTCMDVFDEGEDIYIVSDLMETDLQRIISSKQDLSDEHCQFFLWQALRGLKYVHSSSVIHRDLKPGNMLVNSNCDLKICDFGLARVSDPMDEAEMTTYVVTRWYRAPELIIAGDYDNSIDMWSVGCVLAELLGRKPLFPGRDSANQLEKIASILGKMKPDYIRNYKDVNWRAVSFVMQMPEMPEQPFEKLFPNANPLAIDLLKKMLCYDPSRRISAADALAHPYLAVYHDPDNEPVCDRILSFDFEGLELTRDNIRLLIHNEIEDEKKRKAAGVSYGSSR